MYSANVLDGYCYDQHGETSTLHDPAPELSYNYLAPDSSSPGCGLTC